MGQGNYSQTFGPLTPDSVFLLQNGWQNGFPFCTRPLRNYAIFRRNTATSHTWHLRNGRLSSPTKFPNTLGPDVAEFLQC